MEGDLGAIVRRLGVNAARGNARKLALDMIRANLEDDPPCPGSATPAASG
jgi:hypothetical protein